MSIRENVFKGASNKALVTVQVFRKVVTVIFVYIVESSCWKTRAVINVHEKYCQEALITFASETTSVQQPKEGYGYLSRNYLGLMKKYLFLSVPASLTLAIILSLSLMKCDK